MEINGTRAARTGIARAQLRASEAQANVSVRDAVFAARSAWLMGAGRVIVVDHLEHRLEKARTFAHAETVNFGEVDDIVVEMKKTTDFLGADVAIDAVGAEADGNLAWPRGSRSVRMRQTLPVTALGRRWLDERPHAESRRIFSVG